MRCSRVHRGQKSGDSRKICLRSKTLGICHIIRDLCAGFVLCKNPDFAKKHHLRFLRESWTLQILTNFDLVSTLANPIGTEDLKLGQKSRYVQNGGAAFGRPHKGGRAPSAPAPLCDSCFSQNSLVPVIFGGRR